MREQESDTGAGREGRAASMKKISVIIPAYNSEKYIEQCLWSVTGQTYGNLEIIVVDDGSGDDSAAICGRLAETDGRIRVLRQKNSGVSAARNHGIDAATGEYVFFLDSDDAIHPCLLEEMMKQVKACKAQMVFCDCARMSNSEMRTEWEKASARDRKPQWIVAEGKEAEEWFHIKYVRELSGVFGLIERDCIGTLRFDEELINGEDTLFKYYLFCRHVRVAYSSIKWYFYRTHGESATYSVKVLTGAGCLEYCKKIRDSECQRGHAAFALTWENILTMRMREKYEILKKERKKEEGRAFRKEALMERRNPLFGHLYASTRFLFLCCFICYPMYLPLSRLAARAVARREQPESGQV